MVDRRYLRGRARNHNRPGRKLQRKLLWNAYLRNRCRFPFFEVFELGSQRQKRLEDFLPEFIGFTKLDPVLASLLSCGPKPGNLSLKFSQLDTAVR